MKYQKDPVVEEVRKVRQAIFKSFRYDPRLLGKCLFTLEAQQTKTKRSTARREATILKKTLRN